MNLKLDENLSRYLQSLLEELGHDVLAAGNVLPGIRLPLAGPFD